MQKRLKATVVFGGETDPDPAAAAAALREAGYEVVMMPEKFRSRLVHPRDDFIEVTKRIVGDEVNDAMVIEMMHDVDTIVDRYGGWCDDGGQIDEDHIPFSDMFRGAEDLGEAGDEVEQGKQERSSG
jgi:hypothetical protein